MAESCDTIKLKAAGLFITKRRITKMQNVKKSMGMLCAFVMFACLLFVPTQKAEAATAGMTTLKPNKTYTSYDITGDGKKDKINITLGKMQYGARTSLTVSVNGKKTTFKEYYYDAQIKLITLKNGKRYLWINGISDNDDDPFQALYKYSGGKMKKALDFSSKIEKFGNHTRTTVTKVSGNKVYVRQYLMSAPLGGVTFNYTYEYKKGSFVRTSNTADIKNVAGLKNGYGTLKKAQSLYTSSSCTKKSKTISKNTKVKPLKIYMNGTSISVYVKTKSGSSGWLKCSRNFSNGPILKECFYAG